MSRDGPGPGERRSADDERTLAWSCGQKTGVCSLENLMAKQVVHVVLLDTVVVGGVWRNGMHGEISLDMVDGVRWMVDVT